MSTKNQYQIQGSGDSPTVAEKHLEEAQRVTLDKIGRIAKVSDLEIVSESFIGEFILKEGIDPTNVDAETYTVRGSDWTNVMAKRDKLKDGGQYVEKYTVKRTLCLTEEQLEAVEKGKGPTPACTDYVPSRESELLRRLA